MFYNKVNKINGWENFGALWIIIVGSLLHFTYEWSNNSVIVGIFSPVNESVWEHLKLGYWSLILFSIIEYPFIKKYVESYYLGKALGVIVLEITIIIIYYSYTAITRKSILWIDIFTYVIASIFCQLVSRYIIKKKVPIIGEYIGVIILLILGFALIFFTFYPLKLPIFKDPVTKSYGIYKLK